MESLSSLFAEEGEDVSLTSFVPSSFYKKNKKGAFKGSYYYEKRDAQGKVGLLNQYVRHSIKPSEWPNLFPHFVTPLSLIVTEHVIYN